MSEWDRLLGNASLDAVVRVGEDGCIAYANEAAEALLSGGLVRGGLIGKSLLIATHQRALTELLSASRAAGAPCETDVRLRLGPERSLRARATPIDPERGGGTLVVLDDRSELFHLRTVRTEFVANVSHELRTPLASIRALAETLAEGAVADTELASRFLNTIIREVDRLVRLSEDLLTLARVETSERTPTIFDLNDLVAEVGERLAPYAERREVRVQMPRSDAPVWIEADRSELDQVAFNLLDNGIKYTPAGGVVTVTVDAADRRAILTVQDTGIGMLSEDLPRIFERFWRADRARKFPSEGGTATSGTGLGLSIVKHIVEAHGGAIGVESEFGRGSRLTVSLPLAPPESATSPVPHDE